MKKVTIRTVKENHRKIHIEHNLGDSYAKAESPIEHNLSDSYAKAES
jgi:hypothetical protein